MGHDVFISYSANDKLVADAVCAVLEANGVRCWIAPRDIIPGESWAASILKGIASCRAMVLVFSAHANASAQIRREVERAVHRNIPIAPVRIQDVMPEGDMEYFLSSQHWMDALTPPIERHLRELASKVRTLLAISGHALPTARDLAASAPEEPLVRPVPLPRKTSRARTRAVTPDGAALGPESVSVPTAARRTPRVRPGAVLVVLMWMAIKVPGWFVPGTIVQFMAMMWGPMAGAALILAWWVFASRFPWGVRWTGLAGMVVGMTAVFTLGHPSMRMGFIVFGLPISMTALVLAAVIGSLFGNRAAGALVPIAVLGVWAFLACLRLDGLDGSINSSISFRWTPTAEDRYLAARAKQVTRQPTSLPVTLPTAVVLTDGDWPGFRGAGRDGRLSGVRISTNWNEQPPRQLWRHLIGPGWSSCCVIGDRLFTQEQRGVDEVVVCLDTSTGEELWSHKDRARFAEAMGGAGPRATPTFADGKLYTLGASGILNCLDPLSGNVSWTRNIASDAGAPVPQWGFSASPLVFAGLVTVITGGPGKSLMAYDANTGAPAWAAGDGWSYASPQVAHLAGVDSLLLVTARGVSAFDPLKGQLLWQHDFPIGSANRCVQPALVSDHELLLGAAFGIGTRRISVTHDGGGWKTQAVWTTRKLKPYYNDMVFHKAHIYGFDGSALVCFDPESGESAWRADGYGNGQVLLLADQDLLLVLSEQGVAALVEARPDAHHEIGRFQAIDGKTWNHPVIAHSKLFVRNGQEIACYQVN